MRVLLISTLILVCSINICYADALVDAGWNLACQNWGDCPPYVHTCTQHSGDNFYYYIHALDGGPCVGAWAKYNAAGSDENPPPLWETLVDPPPSVDITFMFDGKLVKGKANPETGEIDVNTLELVDFPGYVHTDANGNPCYNYYELGKDGKWYRYQATPDGQGVGMSATPDWYTGPTDAASQDGLTSTYQDYYSDDNTNLDDYKPAYVPSDTKTTITTSTDSSGREVTTTTTIIKNSDGSTTKNISKTTQYPDGGGSYTENTTSTDGLPAAPVEFDDSGIRLDLQKIRDVNEEIKDNTKDLSNFFKLEQGDLDSELVNLDSKLVALTDVLPSADDALSDVPTDVSSFPVTQYISSYVLGSDILPAYHANPTLCFTFQNKNYCFDSYIFIQFQLIFGWALYAATTWHIFCLFTTHN